MYSNDTVQLFASNIDNLTFRQIQRYCYKIFFSKKEKKKKKIGKKINRSNL